jgi:hypothetical protein
MTAFRCKLCLTTAHGDRTDRRARRDGARSLPSRCVLLSGRSRFSIGTLDGAVTSGRSCTTVRIQTAALVRHIRFWHFRDIPRQVRNRRRFGAEANLSFRRQASEFFSGLSYQRARGMPPISPSHLSASEDLSPSRQGSRRLRKPLLGPAPADLN